MTRFDKIAILAVELCGSAVIFRQSGDDIRKKLLT